ncbi:hypothetical protein L204_103534 [Cryptococcus depauperatus]
MDSIYPDLSVRITSKKGLVLVKDAYMRQIDVMHQWPNSLNPWQAAAIQSLMSNSALYDPAHPLHPGQPGITLYLGYDKANRPRLLFHLRQVEYIQYYIHTMRLSTPSWIKYNLRRSELIANGSKDALKELEGLVEPSLKDGEDDWIPIPDMVLPANLFLNIEKITIPTAFHLTKIQKQLDKDTKTSERHERTGLPPPEFDKKRFDIILVMAPPPVDEAAERLKEKQRKEQEQAHRQAKMNMILQTIEEDRSTQEQNDKEKEHKKQEHEEQEEPDRREGEETQIIEPKYDEDDSQDEEGGEEKEEDIAERLASLNFSQDENGNPLILPPSASLEGTDENTTFPLTEDSEIIQHDVAGRYHYLCQQALITAAEGGFLNSTPQKEIKSIIEDNDDGGSEAKLPRETGRSCFIALNVTRWEEDPSVVLEVGWSALFFQEKMGLGVRQAKNEEQKNPEYEEMRDHGHIIVQDYYLDKRNEKTCSDYRDAYDFGQSIPIRRSELKQTIKSKLQDIWKKAGRGPIFVVTHTVSGIEENFSDIGVDVATDNVKFQPDMWEVPPHMAAAGCNSLFLINTAILFDGIENTRPLAAPTTFSTGLIPRRSEKSLQHIAHLIFGNDEQKLPRRCGNAGNGAFYTLEVFLSIMTSQPLPELRQSFQSDCFRSLSTSGEVTGDEGKNIPEDSHEFVFAGPRNGQMTIEVAQKPDQGYHYEELFRSLGYKMVDSDESVEVSNDDYIESDMIGGVVYEDDEGNLVDIDYTSSAEKNLEQGTAGRR